MIFLWKIFVYTIIYYIYTIYYILLVTGVLCFFLTALTPYLFCFTVVRIYVYILLSGYHLSEYSMLYA